MLALALTACLLLGGTCSSNNGSGSGGCSGSCAQEFLSAADTERIVAQAVAEAAANGVEATIAVVDRVGNVLAVAQTPGAVDSKIIINGGRGVMTGLDGVNFLPATFAAISKAGTGAYLASQGNAFTTRTASQIVQENFNPGETFRVGGPLFGVQFSQLPCGDFVRRFTVNGGQGPKRMPLGLSADPGGIPLYKNGVPVGGVGTESDNIYGADPIITDFGVSLDERIATAATRGFEAPSERRADRIAVDGRFLRFADDENTLSTPADAVIPIPPTSAALVPVGGFYSPAMEFLAGQELLTAGSGVMADTTTFTDAAGNPIPVEVSVNGGGTNRFPPIDSLAPAPGGGGMTAVEVMTLLEEALRVANRARGQIRRPQGSTARVNFSVVDAGGEILGFIRSQDAPIFGADVSLQKARTAAFFSNPNAAMSLEDATDVPDPFDSRPRRFNPPSFYLGQLQELIPGALTDGTAFSDRAGGNLSRPFFPDGINGNPNGPLSRPFSQWSPFSTGLQLDVSVDGIALALTSSMPLEITTCASPDIDASNLLTTIKNGFQIFPGSVPIYRGSQLLGGIGISGDGVDQDDMIAFLGLHNASARLGGATPIANAPPGMRADQIVADGVRLRYVSCPPKPFVDSNAQNVCEGK
ncbi:MAG: heme-binding protein [Myxococcota bacterium]